MALSLKQLLLVVLFACFALAALTNSERTLMLEIVKLVTFGTLVFMAYGIWVNAGERRAYCIGFVLWGGFYYLSFIVIRSRSMDLGTETLLVWSRRLLDQGNTMWAVYEKTGHLLFSLLFGLIGGWVTVYFYCKRQRMLNRS